MCVCYRVIMIVEWIIIIRNFLSVLLRLPSFIHNDDDAIVDTYNNSTSACAQNSPSPHADSCSIEVFHVVQQVPGEKLNGKREMSTNWLSCYACSKLALQYPTNYDTILDEPKQQFSPTMMHY